MAWSPGARIARATQVTASCAPAQHTTPSASTLRDRRSQPWRAERLGVAETEPFPAFAIFRPSEREQVGERQRLGVGAGEVVMGKSAPSFEEVCDREARAHAEGSAANGFGLTATRTKVVAIRPLARSVPVSDPATFEVPPARQR
jgi:hypothetical protein